ncbi:integrase, partial [Acinetobacter baumannii]
KEKIFTHITLRQAIEEYRDTVSIHKKGGIKEVTRLNQFIKIMNVDVSLSEVNKEFLVNFREYRLESVVPATVRRELLMLSGMFSWCIDKKL